MAFGTSGVLGIEIGSNQLRILHGAVAGNLLQVYDYAAEEALIANPENTAQQLGSLVERKGLRSCPAALILSGPGVVHRLLDFPPMPLSELASVVEREMRSVGAAGGEDVVFDWEVIEESDPGSVKQIRVLAAIAPRLEVAKAQELLAQCRVKPALFTTAPVSLLRSLRFVRGDGKGLYAILYVVGEQGYLLGVKDGGWSFYREFSGRASERGEDTLVGEAVKEANRALLYHRQRYREGGEMGFLLSGEKKFEELQMRLHRETGIQAEVVQPGAGVDLSPLGNRASIFRELFPSFVIPLGLVAAVYHPAGINLVPKDVRRSVSRRPSIDLSFVRRPLSALILFLVFSGVHLILVRMEHQYQKILEERAALYSAWRPAIQAAEESRGLRDNERLLEQAIGTNRIGEPGWVVLFKAISRLAQPNLMIQSMSVQKDKGRWLITLKGEVVSPDAYSAQTVFNRFYQGLKKSPYLEQIELLPLNVTTLKEKIEDPAKRVPEGTSGQPAGERPSTSVELKRTRMEFELRGQAKET